MTTSSRSRWTEQHYPDPDSESAGTEGGLNVLIYQQNGVNKPNQQFTSWTALYEEFLKTVGPVFISIDVTDAPSGIATIDAGTWDLQGRATIISSGLNTAGGAQLAIPDGSVLQNLVGMDGSYGDLQLNTASTAVSPLQYTGAPFACGLRVFSAAFEQRGAAPVISVAPGQALLITLDQDVNFNSFPGGFGALANLSAASSVLSLSVFQGLNLFLGAPGNFISGVAGSSLFYLYDASWPGNPTNPNFFGALNAPIVIDNAPFVGYLANPASNWAGTPPSKVSQALDRMASLLKTLNGGAPIP